MTCKVREQENVLLNERCACEEPVVFGTLCGRCMVLRCAAAATQQVLLNMHTLVPVYLISLHFLRIVLASFACLSVAY